MCRYFLIPYAASAKETASQLTFLNRHRTHSRKGLHEGDYRGSSTMLQKSHILCQTLQTNSSTTCKVNEFLGRTDMSCNRAGRSG